MKFFIGIDIGSLTTKVVLLDEYGRLIGHAAARSGYSGKDVAGRLQTQLLTENGLTEDAITRVVATGYGRITYPADKEISEITCQARGIAHLYPEAQTIVDIGGQDSKVIRLFPNGKVADFAMNDKCAAGTGRFLEVMSSALEVDLAEIGDLALSSTNPTPISSFCTVFAESEVISYVAAGAAKSDILAGLCIAVANRVATLSSRTGVTPIVVFTGGVARNHGVVSALTKCLNCQLTVPSEPIITAALGAALIAKDS